MVKWDALARLFKRGATLVVTLSQGQTNGQSKWGTLGAPRFGSFLTNNPLPNGYPWSHDTTSNTNPYTSPPLTGVTRSYDFTVSRGIIAPDGVEKNGLLINNQFPGPVIEANWGDTIQVTVHNQITGPEEGTSLHWHGLLQKATPWYDGVPALQQCPIAPGASFTYRFQADLYGSSWYHSHYSAQYAGGLLGPMIIHGPKNIDYDIDVGPVMLSDHYHQDYNALVELSIGHDPDASLFNSSNSLINGKGEFNCSSLTDGTTCHPNAGLSKFQFTSGKKHRLRLINTSGEALIRFTIDEHKMTVFANDFVPVKPYITDVVTLGVGQRTDVIVEANGHSSAAYWMRSDVSPLCSLSTKRDGLAVIYYENAAKNAKPASLPTNYTETGCVNDDLAETIPMYPITPAPNPDTTVNVDMTVAVNETGNLVWMMNNSSYRANYNHPLLLLANLGNTSYPDDPDWNVYNFGSNKTIRFNIYNDNPASHPMHLHGHNMFILHFGPGRWDGSSIVNPSNPQRRDVAMVDVNSHLVVQMNADNPGVWPLHCHIVWHVSGGLNLNVLERPDDIKQVQIPQVMAQTCRDWAAYTNTTIPDQIDSGI